VKGVAGADNVWLDKRDEAALRRANGRIYKLRHAKQLVVGLATLQISRSQQMLHSVAVQQSKRHDRR
jgi:hypothetical protein